MNKTLIICLVLSLTAVCFAPIHDRPEGSKFYRELNDQEMSRIQGGGMVDSPTGDPVEPKPQAPSITNDATASDAVSSALSGNTSKALAQADRDAKSGPSGGSRMLIWAGMVVGLGLGGVYVLRAYANKAVPMPTAPKKQNW